MLNVVMLSVVAPCLEYDSGIFKSFSKLGFEPGLFRFLINVLTPLSHTHNFFWQSYLQGHCYKTFFTVVIYECSYKASVFVHAKPF